MKQQGRVRLTCTKNLPSGHIDRFTVIVSSTDVQDAIKKYESMGYKVPR
jgi:hypothetical protein